MTKVPTRLAEIRRLRPRTVVGVLRKARKLLAYGWERCASASDRNGVPVAPRDPDARRWCMTGAITAATQDADIRSEAIRWIRTAIDWQLPRYWNDQQDSVDVVLEVFDRAIKNAEANQ